MGPDSTLRDRQKGSRVEGPGVTPLDLPSRYGKVLVSLPPPRARANKLEHIQIVRGVLSTPNTPVGCSDAGSRISDLSFSLSPFPQSCQVVQGLP